MLLQNTIDLVYPPDINDRHVHTHISASSVRGSQFTGDGGEPKPCHETRRDEIAW